MGNGGREKSKNFRIFNMHVSFIYLTSLVLYLIINIHILTISLEMLNKDVKKKVYGIKGQRSKICITVCVSHNPFTHTYTYTYTHILSLFTHTTFPKSLTHTKHNASHLGAGLPAALVHPPSPNFSSHQARGSHNSIYFL